MLAGFRTIMVAVSAGFGSIVCISIRHISHSNGSIIALAAYQICEGFLAVLVRSGRICLLGASGCPAW